MNAQDTAVIATPIGMVRVTGTEQYITSIAIETGAGQEHEGSMGPVRVAVARLREYFAGTRTAFDLPIEPPRTPRGAALREAMCAIDYGETASYGAVAAAIGSSARAIGQACARNSFPIVVPCHRITSAAGPENYSAGHGPSTKRWLLDHERQFKNS